MRGIAALLAVWFFLGVRLSEAIDYPGIPPQPIDMNRDGSADFHLINVLYLNNIPTWVHQETLLFASYDPFVGPEVRMGQSPNGNSALVEAGQLALLSPGEIVGGATTAGRQWVDAFDPLYVSEDNSSNGPPGGWEGIWGTARVGFAGIRIPAEDGLHYGWIKLRVENLEDNTTSYFRGLGPAAVDWYLESRPDTPVVVGAVPEPATWLLIVTAAAICIGWAIFRSRLPGAEFARLRTLNRLRY